MSDTIYCPYTDTKIDANSSSVEHIIPLSLGGSNTFTIPVSKAYNSKVGSDIDGDLANDFLVLLRRSHFDARGHSKKKPKVIVKKSSMEDGSRPVQVEFSGNDGLKVYDPVQRRELSEHEISGQQFNSQFTMSRYGRIKFAAKAALSGGYFVFGEWFKNNVNHQELRALMEFDAKSKADDFSGFGLQVYDEFTPPDEKDSEQYALDKLFCEIVRGSCIYFVPGPKNLGIIVGVLGQYVATLNVPADTRDFPFTELNDLGHAVVIESGQAKRISYRELAKMVHERLPTAS